MKKRATKLTVCWLLACCFALLGSTQDMRFRQFFTSPKPASSEGAKPAPSSFSEGGAVFSGNGPPAGSPGMAAALYVDLATGQLYCWDRTANQWRILRR